MQAWVVESPAPIDTGPLRRVERALPEPGPGQVRVRVVCCGVCRTDLHLAEGDLPPRRPQVTPGHEVVGVVDARGPGATRFSLGERIGVAWLGATDGTCRYCRRGDENLCAAPLFTGWDVDGGYAEWAVAREDFCFAIPEGYPDLQAAPLLCAGLIGWRSLRMTGDAERLGLYGFGASAHIICQVAAHQGRRVFAFTREGDDAARALALELGAEWAGDSMAPGPEELDAAIIFAPVGTLVPAALRASAKGATVVCAGIHMSDIPTFPYEILWGERNVQSVANLTRQDGIEFMHLAPKVPVKTEVEAFSLEQATEALAKLRRGDVVGAVALVTGDQ